MKVRRTIIMEHTTPPNRAGLAALIAPHRPVLIAARTRLLRYGGSLIDAAASLTIASLAGIAHRIGEAHGLHESWPSWGFLAYWLAWISAWLMFIAGAGQSLAVGIVLLAGYIVADLIGASVASDFMLLTVTAIAARSSAIVLSLIRDRIDR